VILDQLSHASRYHTLGPRFAAGLRWLATFDPATADGRYDIDADDVYALVQSYSTVASAEKKYESHRAYADIQFIVSGEESIHYAPTETLTAVTDYDATKDFTLYRDPAPTNATPLALNPNSFAIFLPHDGHKPGCIASAPSPIKKVVIKVRL
jgi:uncharacterized protein, YhcH/YjgK/YiaL family